MMIIMVLVKFFWIERTCYYPFCKIICVFEATMNKHIFIARCGFLTKDFEKSAFKWVQLGICGAENTKYDIFSICGHLQQVFLHISILSFFASLNLYTNLHSTSESGQEQSDPVFYSLSIQTPFLMLVLVLDPLYL